MSLSLNDEQRRPASKLNGAVLVSAGAGSGKTRLLTQRIANLIEKGVAPRNILCITFTNKAAREMRDRLDAMVDTTYMWIMTFHAMCAKLLRLFADGQPWSPHFTIYAEAERDRVLKRILEDKALPADDWLKPVNAALSDWKNDIRSLDDYIEFDYEGDSPETIRSVIEAYQNALRDANAMDFDDLLRNCHRMLSDDPSVLRRVQARFLYISVDEFQDTNRVQYQIVRLLGAANGNVFVVGDEDQSIYGWRGANIENMVDFERDFGATVFKLEQNYRSTPEILDVANKIIAHNTTRVPKTLWTENPHGARVELYCADSDNDEAEYVVRTVRALVDRGYRYSEIAILMRLNALTRAFEERMMSYGVPYDVYGGFKFFERKEVKDVLAYLRLLVNPFDDEACIRVINVPKRGIGESTVTQLRSYCAVTTGAVLSEVCREIDANPDLPAALVKKVAPFGRILTQLKALYEDGRPIAELVGQTIELAGFRAQFSGDDEEDRTRLANLDELIASAHEYERLNRTADLADYLESVTLMADGDEKAARDSVTLSTVHAAKGLEFRAVFVIGLEEQSFPIIRASGSPDDLEEERRLMYVACTRAKERLFLTRAASRYLYGKRDRRMPSRFLGEAGLEQSFSARPAFGKVGFAPARPSRPVERAYDMPARPSLNASVYKVGTVVEHPKFGRGVIKEIVSGGARELTIVTVAFGGGIGVKNLALGLAPLTIAD